MGKIAKADELPVHNRKWKTVKIEKSVGNISEYSEIFLKVMDVDPSWGGQNP